MGTCCERQRDPIISLMSSTASGLAIWLTFLYPAAQILRLLDGLAAAIDPRLSLVGSLHALLLASPAATLMALAAVLGTVWVARRARSGTPPTAFAVSG
jgi:hypothetical protein